MTNSNVAGRLRTTILGTYMIVMSLFLTYIVYQLWPTQIRSPGGELVWDPAVSTFFGSGDVNPEMRLIMLVVAVGALGGYVHTASSFVSYVGNRRFVSSWTWWYVMRPFIGMALAVIFYFVVRGGLMGNAATASDVSPFGIAAVAGLVGMFSKQATDKLEELFNNLFKTAESAGDYQRDDKLGTDRSVLDAMIPLNRITAYVTEDTDASIPLTELVAILSAEVTRVPVMEASGAIRYLIHESVLSKCLADWTSSAVPTLEDLTADDELLKLTRDSIAFVAEDATVGNAKEAMESIDGCQDVIVTLSGRRGEPVIGWLTNVDIGRISRV